MPRAQGRVFHRGSFGKWYCGRSGPEDHTVAHLTRASIPTRPSLQKMTTPINHRCRSAFQWTHIIKVSLPLILIVISGFYIRYESALNTEVIKPLSADAGQYFTYAYNLRHNNTYSNQVGDPNDLKSPVKPDAVRSPGYPLFLTLFVDGLP